MIRGGMVTLGVKDVGAAVRFYVETLGMKLVEESAGTAVIDTGEGFRIALAAGDAKANVTLFAKLPMKEAVMILENRGVAVKTTSDGATFTDPDGHAFTLRQG